MADAQSKILVKLDFEGVDEATKEIAEFDRAIKALSKQQKNLLKDTDNLENATEKQSQQYGNLTERIKKLRREKNDLSRNIKKLDQAEKANLNTIDGLTKRNAKLTAEMRKLDLSTNEGKKRMGELRKEFLANDKQVRTFNESLGRHQHNVGNYQQAIQGASMKIGGMVAAIGAAIAAFRQVNAVISESISLYSEQEKAERALEFATNGNSKALLAQAQALQQNSIYGDEAIIQQQAYLASLGFTNEEITKVIQASADLASANPNISFEAAVRNLSKTYSGLTGELGEAIPQLREFTAEELKAGAATEMIATEYEGWSKKVAEGTGIIDQTKNQIGDLKESFGELLFEAIRPLIPMVQSFVNGLKTFFESASPVERAMVKIGAAIGILIPAFAGLAVAIASTGIGLIPVAIGAAVSAFAAAYASSERFRVGMESVGKIIWEVVKLSLAPLVNGLDLLVTGLNKVGVISDDVAADIKNVSDQFKFNAQNVKDATNAIIDYQKAANNAKFIQSMLDWADATKQNAEQQRELKIETEGVTKAQEKGITRGQQAEQAAKGFQERVDATVESLNQLQGAYIETGDQASLYAVDTDEAMQAQAQFYDRINKAREALEALKGISLGDAINQLAAMTEETSKFERNMVLVGASVTALNDIFATRFENQKQRLEQQTLAEKEAIEQSTMSEEQKRIAIERAEQKKATEIEKIQNKQAKQTKANAIIESLINTAIGITKALATFGPFAFGVIPAIAAIGAVQTGIIAAQQFAEGGQVADLGSGEGGVIAGNMQNIPALSNGDNVLATVKTGEVILNKGQQDALQRLTSPDIFRAIKVPGFADGGVVPSFTTTQQASAARIESASAQVASSVQRIKVINNVNDTMGQALRVQNIEGEATLG